MWVPLSAQEIDGLSLASILDSIGIHPGGQIAARHRMLDLHPRRPASHQPRNCCTKSYYEGQGFRVNEAHEEVY